MARHAWPSRPGPSRRTLVSALSRAAASNASDGRRSHSAAPRRSRARLRSQQSARTLRHVSRPSHSGADMATMTVDTPGREGSLLKKHVSLDTPRPLDTRFGSKLTSRSGNRGLGMAGSKGQRSGGRNRKAPGLHVLQATFRKERHGQAPVSDHVPGGLPEPPVGLPEAVLQHWRIVVELPPGDGHGLACRCACGRAVCPAVCGDGARRRDAVGDGGVVARLGPRNENRRAGSAADAATLVQCFQEITKLRQLEARYATQIRQGRMAQRQYLIELCLTPASRARGVSRPRARRRRSMPKKAKYLDALSKPTA